jgi:hypothetical protein
MAAVRLSFFSLLLLLLAADLFAQEPGTEWNVPWTNVGDSLDLVEDEPVHLTGRIFNSADGQPVSGASVSFDSFQHFDYTDKNGSYFIECLPGTYKVKVRHVGMLPVYIKIRIVSDGRLDIKMTEGVVQLSEVVISSRAIDSNVKESLPGLTKFNVVEIKMLPTLMGEVDIMKSLQLMPGVTSVGEGSSGLNVRGGRTDQNLVMLNDVPLFSTSHALGFVSAFNQDVIEDFTLYKGNVPAQFGGRASSVLDIKARRGSFDEWKFNGGVSPITSRFTAEGPIDTTSTSLIVGGRISHANWMLKKVKDPDVNSSRVAFYDLFGGLTHRFSETNAIDLNFYGSADEFQFSDQFGYKWQNHVLTAKWQSRADKKISPTLSASYGSFTTAFYDPAGVDAAEISNSMKYLQVKESVNIIPNESHNMIVGVSALGYFASPETRGRYGSGSSIGVKKVDKNDGIELGVFANDDYQISDNISVSAGLRFSQYFHIGKDTVFSYQPGVEKTLQSITDSTIYGTGEIINSFQGLEPRISARINVTKSQSVKISYNRMRQYIHQISNTAAPTPIDLWQVSNQYLPPQIADNFSVGYFFNFRDNMFESSAEAFYKSMDNLVEYKDFPTLFLTTHLETEVLSGKGRAYGGELYIRKLKGKWTGWASYTYSQTEVQVASLILDESINDGEWFPSNYNKPHNINLVINRQLQRRGALSLLFSFTSGRPFTAVESSYLVDGTLVPIYSDRNKYHIPNYARVDFSITAGNVINKLEDSLIFSFYNLFGRQNAYSVFYQRPASHFFIPKPFKLAVLGALLPSITYNFKF